MNKQSEVLKLQVQISGAYAELNEAMQKYFNALENSLKCKNNVDRLISRAYAQGLVEGKNQTERDGWIAARYEEMFTMLATLQAQERRSRLQLDLMRNKVEQRRAQMRLLEMME